MELTEQPVRPTTGQTYGGVIASVGEPAHAADALALGEALAPALGAPLETTYATSHREIARLAETSGAAAIVVAPSQARRILAGAPVPVAVAPAGYAATATRMRRIGVAFDGSDGAYAALRWAADLVRGSGASLLLVAVHEPFPADRMVMAVGFPATRVDAIMRERALQQLAIAAAEHAAGLPAATVLHEGDPVGALTAASAELDLVVLGSRGRGPLRAALAGSVSRGMVGPARSPVVIVPAPDASR